MTRDEIALLRKGSIIAHTNGTKVTYWEVDYPVELINGKKRITVSENNDGVHAKNVTIEAIGGGGECVNKNEGCIRVSMLTPNGRGKKRFSLLVSDFTNWSMPVVTSDWYENGDVTAITPLPMSVDNLTLPTFIFTFKNNIKAGKGFIWLKTYEDINDIYIDITDTTQVTISGKTITIKPKIELKEYTTYSISFDDGSVLDNATDEVVYPIINENGYTFSTGKHTVTLTSITPLPNATDVPIKTEFKMVFNELVELGNGSLTLTPTATTLLNSEGNVVALTSIPTLEISAKSKNVHVFENTITVKVPTLLYNSTEYTVTIDPSMVVDADGLTPIDVVGSSVYKFTTVA